MEGGKHLDLPGFRFHPTEEELLDFYLKKAAHGEKYPDIIGTLNLYSHDPWDLPCRAKVGEREWYFFVPRRRAGGGGRPSRTTARGYWKATGCDRPVRSASGRLVGLKKTLVFYIGRAPRGARTDWVMSEYRLPESPSTTTLLHPRPPRDDVVLCKVYRKATSMKELEQRASMEGEYPNRSPDLSALASSSLSSSEQENLIMQVKNTAVLSAEEYNIDEVWLREEAPDGDMEASSSSSPAPAAVRQVGMARRRVSLPELELLQVPQNWDDWVQDPFLTQLRSPWTTMDVQLLSPSNFLNF